MGSTGHDINDIKGYSHVFYSTVNRATVEIPDI